MQVVAPAGSVGGLRASVYAGADAVYLGMPNFGARAKAENFDIDGLRNAVEFAHTFGVKVFVTLNTLIKDSEMPDALLSAEQAYDLNVDAAIVQDIRFIKVLKTRLPDFTLHASTQMGIHNADGAKQLIDLGIRRAVLARETLPSDIAEIKKTGIEIEFFVQGALCISFSGNCYFSSLASSYSGNRGRCMQLCRKTYDFDGKRGCFLSAKDICLYDKLDYLESLGVDAIKIEGRMRSDEYAYRAVSVYKKKYEGDPVDGLKSAFNRGDYCSAYLQGNAPFRVVYPEIQGNIGVSVGKIEKVRGNSVIVKGYSPDADDGFKVLRGGKELCGAHVENGAIVADKPCRAGDELRRTFDGALKKQTERSKRTLPVSVSVSLFSGKIPRAVLSTGSFSVEAVGEKPCDTAISRALVKSDVFRVFTKVADFPFEPDIALETDGEAFLPVSELNELRRRAYSELQKKITESYSVKRSALEYKGLNYNKFDGKGVMLMVEDGVKLTDEISGAVDYLVINPRDYAHFDVPKTDIPVLLNLPVTMRGDDRETIVSALARRDIFGGVSNNLYSLGITDKPLLLGPGHNIIGDCEHPHVTSFEADKYTDGFSYTFGYAPVMTLCHCPYGHCVNCSGKSKLTDDHGRVFPLRRYKAAHCYWQLLNCVPTYLPESGKNRFYDCTHVPAADIPDILRGAYKGNFTRGNMNKGLK